MRRKSFHNSLDELIQDVSQMGTLIENAICSAVKSLEERDLTLAQKVVADDDLVDNLKQKIEETCLTMLALQQPMAVDLRIIGNALKIVTDLERIADHAVDIARITIKLRGEPLIKPLVDIPKMAKLTQEMVRDSLNAYIDRDENLAQGLALKECKVDHLYRIVFEDLMQLMAKDPTILYQGVNLLLVALYLERVGDHVVNIGEWIIFMITGKRKSLNFYDELPGE
jgi:phosphate transport system protein